jgi:isopentenyl phosphate kinase
LNEKSKPKDFQIGISLTRQSVIQLNQIVVGKLINREIPAIGISCLTNFSSCGGEFNQIDPTFIQNLTQMLDLGMVPVIHGDVILDSLLKCKILSGDEIISQLSSYFKPEKVIFISNVCGIYTQPPIDEEKETNNLIQEISVGEQGDIEFNFDIITSDVTGGIKGKFENAIQIAKLGIDVYICKSEHFTSEKLLLSEKLDKNDNFTKISQKF